MKFKLTSRLATIFASLHFLYAIGVFINVHGSEDAQALMAWTYFLYIDYPIGQIIYENIGIITDRNIRAGIAFGILGTVYWYVLGLLLSLAISSIKAKNV